MRILLIGVMCLAMTACERGTAQSLPVAPPIDARVDDAATPWTSLAPLDDPDDFHFVVVTDRTGQHRPGVFSGAMPKVNLLAPAFVVSVGDLIEGYTENQESLDREWDEFEGFIEQLEAPFFYTPGNHDMSNAVMAETWRTRFGPSYYHFEYKDVLFLVLNSELFGMVGQPDVPLPGPWSQAQQMQFVETVLAENGDARWTIVLLHQPLWDTEQIDDDWLRVETLLGQRNYTVFAGHYHRYSRQRRHDRNYITLATTGGGSGLRGPLFGEFDHVAWVTMRDDGPRIANVMLDGIADEDVSNPSVLAGAEALAGSVLAVPGVGSGEAFAAGTQAVRLHNPGDAELYVTPALTHPGNFDVEGLEPITLQPGTSTEITLELAADPPLPYRDLHAAAVTWTLTSEVQGRPAQIRSLTPILPLTTHAVAEVAAAPVIDGDLSEWGELGFVVARQGDIASRHTTADDVSFRFDVRQDDEALYVAVDVTDDSLVASTERIARDQDTIVVAVDTRDEVRRNRSMEVGQAVLGGDMAAMAMTMLTVEPAAEDKLLPFLAETAAGTTSATVRSDGGYRAELAVPHQLLDAKAGGSAWQAARIVVSVYDFDEGESGNVVLHWQPYRYGNAPLPGTHTFARSL